jgi:hypothetical protein
MQVTMAELMDALPDILAAPKDDAPIHSLCLRPGYGQRRLVDRITMTRAGGIPGERWATAPWLKLDDGSPDPRIQVSILPLRVMDLVWRDRQGTPHPGDPIVADMDLTLANLPTGSLIAAGTAVLRVSGAYNMACAKWKVRYGADARAFIDGPPGHVALRLRGILCSVEVDGEVTQENRLKVLRRGT